LDFHGQTGHASIFFSMAYSIRDRGYVSLLGWAWRYVFDVYEAILLAGGSTLSLNPALGIVYRQLGRQI
jgi:hypothetical protein